MTRSVRDALAIDDLLNGRDQRPVRQARNLKDRRFWVEQGVLEDPRVEHSVRDNLLRCVAQLEAAGAVVDVRPSTTFQATLDLIQRQGWLGSFEAFALHEALLDSPDATQLDPRVRRRLEAARRLPASQLLGLYDARRRLQQQLLDELDGAILITPTVAHVAPALAPLEADDELFVQTNLATLRLTMPGSLLDMPGVTLPSGHDALGLPTGLLLSAPSGEDRLLSAALSVETVLIQ